MIADVTPLIGRRFPATSGNVAGVVSLGDGAVRVTWTWKPSGADIAEFTHFAERVLMCNLETKTHLGLEGESAALDAWRRETEARA